MRNPFDQRHCLTRDLPGTGGRIRQKPEDFVVEEVPLYRPSGTGTHLFLLVEKRGISTFEAVSQLARALNRRPGEFGFAGLKDAEAVTRQYISIEHVTPAEVQDLDFPRIRILDTAHHGNKLKLGHLKGNRFRILLRDPKPDALGKAEAVLNRLTLRGVPNFFGPQRFGNFGNTHLLGQALLKGDDHRFVEILLCTPRSGGDFDYQKVIDAYKSADYEGALRVIGHAYKYERRVLDTLVRQGGRFTKAVMSIDKRMLRFYLSAFQSHYFNKYLERRLDRLDRLERGEVAYIHKNGASFLVEDPEQEAQRIENLEISPSGPIYGNKMLKSLGRPGQLEEEILRESGLELEEIQGRFGIRMKGARRPLRVPLEDRSLREAPEGLELSFRLPMGAYATVVLREVTKCLDGEIR